MMVIKISKILIGSDLLVFYNDKYLQTDEFKIDYCHPFFLAIKIYQQHKENDIVELINPITNVGYIYRYSKKTKYFVFYRRITSALNKKNLNEKQLEFNFDKVEREPKNNDGRTRCYWCGEPTKTVMGFIFTYSICENCGK